MNLPWNEEAEKIILSILLSDTSGKVLDELVSENLLFENDFYHSGHKIIYKAICDLVNESKEVDYPSIIHKLNYSSDSKEAVYIKDILMAYMPGLSAKHYANMLKELKKRRIYINAAASIAKLASDTGKDIATVNEQINKLILFDDEGRKLTSGQDVFINVYQDISEKYGKSVRKIENGTGWSKLDRLTGGFEKGELIIIGARPGMGKSVVGQNIAEYKAFTARKKVLMFSLEMSSEQVVRRILASRTGLKLDDLRKGTVEIGDFKTLQEVGALPEFNNLIIDDSATPTIEYIKSVCRAAKRQHKELGCVIIDYLQLMKTDFKNRIDGVADISRGLKLMAKELQCPVIALSQLNRANEREREKRPMLSDLRESGSLEQDADKVILLYRDEYYHRDTVDKGIIEMIVAKSREGKTGTVKNSWQPQIMRVMSLEDVNKVKKKREYEQMKMEEKKNESNNDD